MIVAAFLSGYLLVAAAVLGALLERERLLNPDGERGGRWLGSLALAVVFWPILGLLWAESRPAPLPQPDSGVHAEREELPPPGSDLTVRPTWTYLGPVTVVDTPGTLPISGVEGLGSRVYVRALGLVLVREELAWGSSECSCRYNFSGFPVVLCRGHRSDTDPQGEPDESEGDVGL
jgi:hypothetical protein